MVHGEDEVTVKFCALLKEKYNLNAEAPFSGSIYDLAAGKWIKKTEGIPFVKPGAAETAGAAASSAVYKRLLGTEERLRAIISQSKGLSNKDLSRLADQLQSICDKWGK